MMRRFENWAFYVGRDLYRGLDMQISVSFGARPNPPINEFSFRWNCSCSWNWLPDRIYRTDGKRTWFIGVRRWHRAFEFRHVKDSPC